MIVLLDALLFSVMSSKLCCHAVSYSHDRNVSYAESSGGYKCFIVNKAMISEL